jgi:hypothetical protein
VSVPSTMPDVSVPGTVPDVSVPGTVPDVSVPATMPDVSVPTTLDDDARGDDDRGQVPAGGVATGEGGATEIVRADDASATESDAGGGLPGMVPLMAGGLGAVAGGFAVAKLAGRRTGS